MNNMLYMLVEKLNSYKVTYKIKTINQCTLMDSEEKEILWFSGAHTAVTCFDKHIHIVL